jgi:hypothetical protein
VELSGLGCGPDNKNAAAPACHVFAFPIIAQGYSLHHVVTKLRIQKLTSLSETDALVI